MESELLDDQVVQAYVLWRVRLTVAQRMDDIAAEAAFRMARDPVLSEAIRLLGEASSQAELFRVVDSSEWRGEEPPAH